MAHSQNVMLATLDLICAPIPNSRVSRMVSSERIVEFLRTSDFYMIGGRAKASFTAFKHLSDDELGLEITVSGGAQSRGALIVSRIPPLQEIEDGAPIKIKYNEDFIWFATIDANGVEVLRAGFSTEEILWWRGRKESFVVGFDNHLDLACYDLLYVGIATETDSYSRLIKKGHVARQQILSEEVQRYPGARVSDEIFLMLFRADPLLIKSWAPEDEIEDGDLVLTYSNERLVKDAEKAFISVLRPPYNKQLYAKYPMGKDGHYGEGYTGYSYSLSDGITIRTAFGAMKGARESYMTMSNDADFISIQGDSVSLHIAGVNHEMSAESPFSMPDSF